MLLNKILLTCDVELLEYYESNTTRYGGGLPFLMLTCMCSSKPCDGLGVATMALIFTTSGCDGEKVIINCAQEDVNLQPFPAQRRFHAWENESIEPISSKLETQYVLLIDAARTGSEPSRFL